MNKKLQVLFLFSLCIVIYSSSVFAASNIATQIERRYSLVSSMSSSFTQILVHKESGSVKTKKGTLQFKKPMLARWETESPSPEILVVGKNNVFDVFPDEEIVYQYPLSIIESSTNIIRVITGSARLDQNFTIEDKGIENGLIKLHIYPHDPSQTLVEATLWVEKTTSIIKKIVVYDFYGNTNEITFTRQDLGVDMKDSTFIYTPPANFTLEKKDVDQGGTMGK